MFIRTKDGIYETRENGETYNGFGCKFNNGTIKIHKKDILNQSENLEELCDEFVLYDNILKTYGVFDKKIITFKWLQNHLEIYKGMTIYGAIYTFKGLIYVAKMDNDGKLVLI